MWEWLWIVVLYVLGIGAFHWLGGISAAAEAVQQWGHASADRRRRPQTPST